ncbi:BnaC03g56500D [Brassica napus]|uniref:BnaC03g56500D protein n=1 Tax=Brassica napus TaxID=3708 RepID=A0A078H7S9_BRANA|nr:BnaC03g56500D [Brassica napus]
MRSTGFHLRAHVGDESSTRIFYQAEGTSLATHTRVQEEVRSLRQKVDEMAAEIAQLKDLLTRK